MWLYKGDKNDYFDSINIDTLVMKLYLCKIMTFQGNWVKGILALSELFLTTACASTTISIKISIKNIQ